MCCSYEKTKDICKGQHWLLACNSGVLEEGIAQQLADLLQVPVLAPQNYVIISTDGYVAVADNDEEALTMMLEMKENGVKSDDRGWKTYYPKEENK